MTSTGMLDADAHGFAEREARGQKWLIGDYEAGDAVFHHTCKSAWDAWTVTDRGAQGFPATKPQT